MSGEPTRWILGTPAGSPDGDRLFCFPHAGSGASAFTAWRAHLPEAVELYPVQLPGRENRSGEPMPDTLDELAARLADDLLPLLRPPYLLFGHSFGGLVCYALTTELHRRGHPLPRQLLISGARPPHLAAKDAHHTLAHDELLSHVRDTGGISAPLLEHPAFVRRLLDVVRNDLRMAAEFSPAPAAALPCPVTVFAAGDDPVVSPAEMEDWRDYAGGEFVMHRGPGDHYAVYDPSGAFFSTIVRSQR
jgi:medium-chain acyl-[acyl-carrier-protein] hydrolase